MTDTDISQYGDHTIRLEYENVSMGGFALTNWFLFVDRRPFYLGQDSKFVTRVLGRDFAEFIHEAFLRADLKTPAPARELNDSERDLLRASLAAGIVRALDDLFADRDLDLFAELEELEPWSLAAD